MFDTYYIKHKKYIEQIKEDIVDAEKVLSTSGDLNLKSFDLHDKLNDKVWDEHSNLKPGIRENLMQIARDFYDTLDISEITEDGDPDAKPDPTFDKYIKDVLFVGSLASFNYSSYADVDLHLLMDENKVVGKNKLALNILKKYFTECKNDWNLKHTDLNVEGYDCELYVQDVNETNAANGVYSLFNDEWIKRPEPMTEKNLDRAWVEKKALDYIEQIDSLEELINSKADLELVQKAKDELKKIKDKIVQGRRDSLAAGQGEMNSYNILFKILRRSGHIGKINDLTVKAYDMLNSINNTNNLKEESTMENVPTVIVPDYIKNEPYVRPVRKILNTKWKWTDPDDGDVFDFIFINSNDLPLAVFDIVRALKEYEKQHNKKLFIKTVREVENEYGANEAPDNVIEDYANKLMDLVHNKDLEKESVDMKTDERIVRESDVDAIAEFGRMYGRSNPRDLNVPTAEELEDLLKKYLSIKSNKTAEQILVSDREFMKFSNWAYDKYKIDVYAKFKKFDKGTFHKSTSDLIRDPEQRGDKRYSTAGDDTRYSYDAGDAGDFDSATDTWREPTTFDNSDDIEESIVINGNEDSILVLEDNEEETKSIEDKSDDKSEEKPDEKPEEKDEKKIIYLGKIDDNTTIVISIEEPTDEANKILNKYNTLAKSKYEETNGNTDGYKDLQWLKDDESYNYWYFAAPKKMDEVKSEIEKEFGNSFKIEIKESKEEETTIEQNATHIETTPKELETEISSTVQEQPKESESTSKIIGATWDEFLKNIEEQTIYKVDSSFKRHPNQWIELIDRGGYIYDAEVTKYEDGEYELLFTNISPVPNAEESKKVTPINESYADDALDNIKGILRRYFEVDPETEEPNEEYDEDFTAQDALDEIVDILY